MSSLSVIIPIYNGERHLSKLKDIFAALEQQPEIIFVDDGSTDRSKEMIGKYFPDALCESQKNSGVATARNTGARIASKDYLLFLDCDDVLNTNTLWDRVAIAEQNNLDVLTSSWRMEVRKDDEATLEDVRKMDTPDNVYNALMAGNWWGPPHAYIVKKSAYRAIGGSDENLVNAQDFDVWIRLAIADNKWGSCQKLAGHYVRDLGGTSLARGSRKQYWSDTETVINNAFELLKNQHSCDEAQRLITARRLHEVARNVYAIDHAWYQNILKRVYQIAPNFTPTGSLVYRSIARLFGLKLAEHTAQLKIQLTRIKSAEIELPSPCDVLVVIYARLKDYPSSKFQVEILREAGLHVAVIEEDVPAPLSSSRYIKLLSCFRFGRHVRAFIKINQPTVVIAYDTFGIYLTGKTWKHSAPQKTVWHFHELPHVLEPTEKVPGSVVKRAETFIVNHLEHPDALVFPDANRARHLKDLTGTTTQTYTAMNCPRLRDSHDASDMRRFKEKHHIPDDAEIVYFHGALAQSRCLDTVIESIPQWKRGSHLIMIGPVETAYKETLDRLIQSLDLEHRVHYFSPLPYETVMDLAAGAQIGISIVHKNAQPNWRFSAGAVNKRFEYMAMGLPQITDNGVGVSELIENCSCGLLLDNISPRAVAEAVNALLNDPHKLDTMRQNGLNQHATIYHYEKQFAELKTQIIDWVKTAS